MFRGLKLTVTLALVGGLISSASAATINSTYTAEGLTPAASITSPQQDNWQVYVGGGGATAETVVHPVDGSTTVLRSAGVQLSRINDGSFDFLPHVATDTSAELVFDAHFVANSDLVFGLGRNLASNNNNNLGPVFGMGGGGFFIRQAVYGSVGSQALSGSDGFGDWYRLKLTIDFTANGGDGAGNMYVMNLTDGETDYRVSPVFGNFNLGITSMTALAQDPATWNSLYVRLGANNEADNLNPNFVLVLPPPPAPEPSTGVLLLVGLLAFRRRVSRS